MFAEDRLQALEQLVTVMQSEIISARTTTAGKRVLGVRGEGVVRTSRVRRTTGDISCSRSWDTLVQ